MAVRGREFHLWREVKQDFIIKHLNYSELSRKYGISDQQIGKIARRKDPKTGLTWEEERREYDQQKLEENIEVAKKTYIRDRTEEAKKFNILKGKLVDLIDYLMGKKRNIRDIANLAKAITALDEREGVLCGEASIIQEQHITQNFREIAREFEGLDIEQLKIEFEKEKKKLLDGGGPNCFPELKP